MLLNALAFIDKLQGCLTRNGPGSTRTTVLVPDDLYLVLKPGVEIIGATVVPREKLPGLTYIDLGESHIIHSLKLARAYYEVIYDSYPEFIRFDLNQQLEAYITMASWSLIHFVKNAKFFTAYGLARFLRNPLPERPDTFTCHWSLFTGAPKRFFKSRIISFNKKNMGFFLGTLQGVKRGAEVVPESFILEALRKHKKVLTDPFDNIKETSWAYRVDFEEYCDRFFRDFRKVTPALFEASSSAGAHSVRSEGGQRGFIQSLIHGDGTTSRIPRSDELLLMHDPGPRGNVQTFRGAPTWRSFSSFRSDFGLMRQLDTSLDSKEVHVAAVLEPLKVRLITKGNEMKYYHSKFYQRALWKYLQRFPQFGPTGCPISEGHIYDLLEREHKIFGEKSPMNLWCSGDYSSATDLLKLPYTKAAFEASLRRSGLSTEVQEDLRDVLYEQDLIYPKAFTKKHPDLAEKLSQQRGQLMGSTLSFPILCVVNLICYWSSMEKYTGKKIPLKDLPVLVNGDDILFRTNSHHRQIWLQDIKEVGFQLSVGKNYFHDTFLIINSQGYVWKKSTEQVCPIGYLNVGLLTGQSKLNKRPEEMKPVADLYNSVLAGAADKLRAHRRFLHYHSEEIREVTNSGNFSLFLSPVLGGCGFKLYPEVRGTIHFTSFQIKLAHFLYDRLQQPTQSESSPTISSYRLPKMKGGTSASFTLGTQHEGSYRFLPLTQPLSQGQREVRDPPSLKELNYSFSGGSEGEVLLVRSFPIKTLLSFREELAKYPVHRHSRLPKNGLFEDLQLRIVEDLPKSSALPAASDFDVRDYWEE